MGNLTTKGIGWAIAGACFFAFYRKNQQEIDYAVDEMDAAAYPDYVPQAYLKDLKDTRYNHDIRSKTRRN